MIRRREPHAAKRPHSHWATIAHRLTTVLSWCALNGLAALGLVVLVFILFANASFEGFFREGMGLSAHYLAAAPAVRASFQHLVGWLFAGAFVLLAAMRARGLIAGLRVDAAMAVSTSTVCAI
ncbi:MAG: hypothetical protein JF595_10475 [Sphingomonadales bacterium]|nr:hypothetical protein [Sphingomonadales bacterium]